MASCVGVTSDNYLKLDPVTNLESCSYVLINSSELPSSNLELNIDPELYTTVSGYMLLAFVSGHVLGRIIKTMGRHS